jgi:hypothetical protein
MQAAREGGGEEGEGAWSETGCTVVRLAQLRQRGSVWREAGGQEGGCGTASQCRRHQGRNGGT